MMWGTYNPGLMKRLLQNGLCVVADKYQKLLAVGFSLSVTASWVGRNSATRYGYGPHLRRQRAKFSEEFRVQIAEVIPCLRSGRASNGDEHGIDNWNPRKSQAVESPIWSFDLNNDLRASLQSHITPPS